MGRFFDLDGPVITFLTKLADIFILNLLLIICSLPIFTFGAAYTAVYYVTLKMVRDEDGYTVKSFFKSFKMNFKQATVIWIIMLLIGGIIVTDWKVTNGALTEYANFSGLIRIIMTVFIMASTLIYIFTLLYVFPVLSRFDNTTKNTIRNALLMSVRHLPSTIAIIFITIAPIVLMYLSPRFLVLVVLIFSLSAYINSYLFVKIFKNYMPEENSVITPDDQFEVILDDKEE